MNDVRCLLCGEQAAYTIATLPSYVLAEDWRQDATVVMPAYRFCCACGGLYLHHVNRVDPVLTRLDSLRQMLREPDLSLIGWSYVVPPPEWVEGMEP